MDNEEVDKIDDEISGLSNDEVLGIDKDIDIGDVMVLIR